MNEVECSRINWFAIKMEKWQFHQTISHDPAGLGVPAPILMPYESERNIDRRRIARAGQGCAFGIEFQEALGGFFISNWYDFMFTDLSSRDESFERFLSTFHGLVPHAKIELDGGRSAFRWQGKFAATSGFSWWKVESEIDWTCRISHQKERLGLVLPSAGTVTGKIRNRTVVIDRKCALALTVPEVNAISYAGCGKHGHVTLEFDVATVQRILSGIFEGASLRSIELSPQLDLASPAGQMLKALAEAIGAGMQDASLRSDKSMALFGESILRLVFLNFPHALSDRPRRQQDATPRQIREAIDFMRANMHQALTLSEVAEAVGISVRTLQYGLYRFRNVTPQAYLRQIRLEAVQAELSSPLNALSVKDVAQKWGFAHMGHFAARYRAAYGESPSETARLARAGTLRVARA